MMRKMNVAGKMTAVALFAAMLVPTVTVEAVTAFPMPVAGYDFESGIEAILEEDENAAVVNSEIVYVKKTADKLEAGEKIDANGLVFTGSGAEAQYVTVAAIGTPTVIEDEERGSVLQFDDTTITVDRILKIASAAVPGDEEATKALDKQILLNDYYYIEAVDNICPTCEGVNAGEATVCTSCGSTMSKIALNTQEIAPTLKVSNPFAGLADYFKEYDELEDVTPKKYGTKYSPLWTKGITISYWVKSTTDENGKYEPASVLRWENDNQIYYQADGYAKYLTCKKFDVNYAKMSDENKELAFKYSPSGVFMYKDEEGNYIDPDGLMDYYFQYKYGFYKTDENGNIIPVLYMDENGVEGPVYDFALMEAMNASGKGRFDGTGRFYFSNPFFKPGFQQNSDGSLTAMYHVNYYNTGFSALPEIAEDGTTVEPGKSKVRYGLVDGELQIDVDNSIFFVPDNVTTVNQNPNDLIQYGRVTGMQNGDVFFMNSWQESTVVIGTGGTYKSAAYVALSPVSGKEDEMDSIEDTTITKHSNAGEWHHVAITMMNDWVEFYVDGEFVDVYTNYSSRGGVTLDTGKSFKRFNKGAGMRYGFGSEKDMGNIFYGNYVCRVLLDWLSDENSYLNFGGIGNYAEDYNQATTTAKVCMDDVYFFKEVLSEAEILALAGGYIPNPDYVMGDTDGNEVVDLTDAKNALMLALGIDIEVANAAAADVNSDGVFTLDDAQSVLKAALGIKE